jgi:pyruvate,water dikinase
VFTQNFKDLNYKNVDIAGGKGASLGEMTQAGLAVPPGFVVLASAFDKFLAKTDLNVEIEAALKKADYKDIKSIEAASVKIRDLIRDAEFPADIAKEVVKSFKELGAEFVAVRSSATAEDSSIASWAGELETYLNVTEENLLDLVKKCWSSLFTPRAIFYRYEKNLHERKVSVAVVIQKMVQSEVSGICFTVHPVTEDLNQLVIEAGWGLGEAIVGGMITPDTYIINKKENIILDTNISKQEMKICRTPEGAAEEIKVEPAEQEKQKLDNENIIKLAELCQKIEDHYKAPQDIEWAYEGGKFYITQSRPITTLGK